MKHIKSKTIFAQVTHYLSRGCVYALIFTFSFSFFALAPFSAPIAHAGISGFATEITQQANRARLDQIITLNQDIRDRDRDVRDPLLEETLEETIRIREIEEDMQQFWREELPEQWQSNIEVIQEMVDEVIEFAQSGFQGDPAFVTDLTRYLERAQDDVATRFIQNLGGVTELPVQTQLQQILGVVHNDRRTVVRFNDGVVNRGNLEAFYQGDRQSTGGWDGFRHMVLGEGQTALDAYFRTQMALDDVVRRTTENQLQALNWSDGFLSSGQCEVVQGRQVCEVTTPGSIISNQINSALETGFDVAVTAQLTGLDLQEAINGLGDGMDEGVFAGLRNLTNDILHEATGLMSLNDFMAGFNLDRLLRDLNPDNIFAELSEQLLDILFGSEDNILDTSGNVASELIDGLQDNIEATFGRQADLIAELGRLADLIGNLPDNEAVAIYTAVLGPDFETQFSRIDENYQRLFEISNDLDDIAGIANRTGRTQVEVFRELLNEMSRIQERVPSRDTVAAWSAEIDRQALILNQ